MTAGEDHASLVAITGLGVLTPLGDNLAALWEALLAGREAVRPAVELPGAGEAALADFDATTYANIRGMRIYNRATRLGICATKLALDDARLASGAVAPDDLGVVLASTFGHLDTLIDYDRSLVTVGLQRTNPALMPLGLPSAPGAAIALAFGAKAFSITLASGGTSSLDAMGLGTRLVASGRARACVVVGAFALCRELSLGALRAGWLAPADAFYVLDRRHAGTAFGEAAVAIVLERADDAAARGAAAKGYVLGQASTFAAGPVAADSAARALARACARALAGSGIGSDALRLVAVGAGGSPSADDAEAGALLETLAGQATAVPVVAPKANLGDAVDAGGLVQVAVALAALASGQVPALVRFAEPAVSGLHYPTAPLSIQGGPALVTSLSTTGACAALVLGAAARA